MSRCYVGNLPPDPSESALLEYFEGAGKVIDVQVKKTISGDYYAFIHFSDPESPSIAVKKFDGLDFLGARLRVELPFAPHRTGQRRSNGYVPPPNGPRVAVRVAGIPESGSWQDLKDHFREAGDCVFADTYGDGTGVVEYTSYEDARRAIKLFDRSSFRSHQGETGRLELELAPPGPSNGGSSGQGYGRERGSGRSYDSPYRREPPMSRSSYYHGGGGRESYREPDRYRDSYGPVRGDRYYGKEGEGSSRGGRDRSSPPPRRNYSRRSPPPSSYHRGANSGGGPPSYDDDRYTTQDSRSTDALSTRSTGRDRSERDRDFPDHARVAAERNGLDDGSNGLRRSPGRKGGALQDGGSWSMGQQSVRDMRGESEPSN